MDALEVRRAFTKEFRAIGDENHARQLIQNVIPEDAGNIQAKARQTLNKP